MDTPATQPVPPPPRTRLFIFHGTRGDPTPGASETLLTALPGLFTQPANVEIHHIPGVGTRSGPITNLISSGLGSREVRQNIIDSYSHLAANHKHDDEIVIIGYSRGSYTARSFVGFLDRVGLPAQSNRSNLRELYEKYVSGKFLQGREALHLRAKHKCRDIRIKAMICIDTVGSLGFPRTGAFGLFNFLRSSVNRHKFMEPHAASNVDVMLHALALHETRGPFKPTLMYIKNDATQVLKQVWFPGSHGDIAREIEAGCIADAVLAWLVANIEQYTSITFDEDELAIRFPRMATQHHIATLPHGDDKDDWVNDPMYISYRGIWRLMGRGKRVPGSWQLDGM
ncbi:unnamed protein product [Clonostachys rosea]|uniref:T6SS Phospholipase effector Tle1-like catalytic domain-containing protein n=1 Tax=Bionectria ochroleuca TaxID=29856 RepID=A0ABY6UI86_BIOOC|nr:unnamed protein product [Clonostachys rosea]